MPVVTVGSLLISIIAVGIAIHTKLQQRESRELRKIAEELEEIHEGLEATHSQLQNHKSHIDLENNFEMLTKEILACKHDVNTDTVQIFISCYITIRDDNGNIDSEEIEDTEKLIKKYKDERINIGIRVGNREELHMTNLRISLFNPINYIASVFNSVDEIEEQHTEKLEKFDKSLLHNVRNISEKIIKSHSTYLANNDYQFEINIENHKNTEAIEKFTFEEVFYYEDIEEDLDELKEIVEEVEELKKGIIQASYS